MAGKQLAKLVLHPERDWEYLTTRNQRVYSCSSKPKFQDN